MIETVATMADAALPEPEAADTLPRALAVQCGALRVALPHGWARAAVDCPDLTPVPRAPDWLVGAANIDGEITPVVDLAAWCGAGDMTDVSRRDLRLLLGGHGSDALALLFNGLPRLVRVHATDVAARSTRLAAVAIGDVLDEPDTPVLDGAALLLAIAQDLNPQLQPLSDRTTFGAPAK
jgi:chemotaxis signal transduction protein